MLLLNLPQTGVNVNILMVLMFFRECIIREKDSAKKYFPLAEVVDHPLKSFVTVCPVSTLPVCFPLVIAAYISYLVNGISRVQLINGK